MATASDAPRVRRQRPRRLRGAMGIAGLAAGLLLAGCSAAPAGPPSGAPPAAADVSESADAAQAPATSTDSPTPATEQPLVTTGPDEHSEVGDLVEDFPIDLLPVPGDALILVTSAVPVGDSPVQEVSLNLQTQEPADAVLDMYRDALTGAGFTEAPPAAPQADLAVETTFTRSGGDELVSIGVLDVDGSRTVTIGGRVHTDA